MLNQFRLFMQMQQSYQEAPATTAATLASHAHAPGNPINVITPPLATQSVALSSLTSTQPAAVNASGRNPPIIPYQSARRPSASTQNMLFPSAPIATSGAGSLHFNGGSGLPAIVPAPPQGMGPGTGLGTHFLGFQQRTGQANQARLAAAAQNLPRRPALPNRRHHLGALSTPSSSQASSALTQSRSSRRTRGPSGQRPHAHRQHPELSDVVYSPSGQGEPTHSHIRVKVLPDCGVSF